jgi:hypothetical protein
MGTADGTVLGTTQIFGSAPRNRAFNVVLLAEGFTAAQQNAFNIQGVNPILRTSSSNRASERRLSNCGFLSIMPDSRSSYPFPNQASA